MNLIRYHAPESAPWSALDRWSNLRDDLNSFFEMPFSTGFGRTSQLFTGWSPALDLYESGDHFVAVVEFGKTVRAKAVTVGGESGDPSSPHFNDQAKRYSTGDLRDVYFYRSQLKGHTKREYHPGN